MTERKLSQKEKVFQAVLKVLGDKYNPTQNMASHFHPINKFNGPKPTNFSRGPLNWESDDNPLLIQVIKIAHVPRNAVFDALRRDPRLNGGVKRKWKTKKHLRYDKMVRFDSLVGWSYSAWRQSLESPSTPAAEKELLQLRISLRHAHILLAASGINLESLPERIASDIGLSQQDVEYFRNYGRDSSKKAA